MYVDRRIRELVDFAKVKFGLNNYYLQRHQFYRSINILNETVYTLSMEWFPNHVIDHEDDGSNPEGTASIEINVNNRKFKGAIFVMGKSYAENEIMFANRNTEDIIKWVEDETGLTEEKYFNGDKIQLNRRRLFKL